MKSLIALITAAFLFIGLSYSKALAHIYPTSFSFQSGSSQIHLRLDPISDNINRLLILTLNDKEIINSRAVLLPWPIYQFQMGDIDDDNINELFVGVTKSCPYDPLVRRRLFVYEIIDGDIRAKWLGTHLAYDLKDFRTITIFGKAHVRTLEQDGSGEYHIITYAWAAFGPRLINNQEGGRNYGEAFKIYNSDSSFSVASAHSPSQDNSGAGGHN